MPITVTMIEEKVFKTTFRGYDPLEVDEYLDDICDEMIEMQNTIQSLREQVKQLSAQPFAPLPISPVTPPVAKAPDLPRDLEAARRLLEETQLACDKVLDEAKKRAESQSRGVESQAADPDMDALYAEKERLEQEIQALNKEAQSFRSKLQAMLKNQSEMLETEFS